jgi:hypothetical protein
VKKRRAGPRAPRAKPRERRGHDEGLSSILAAFTRSDFYEGRAPVIKSKGEGEN